MPKFIQNLFKKRLDYYEMKDKDYNKIMRVPYMTGAFMIIRKSILDKVGLFDENIFLYFEDTDLSRRINNVSKIIYYPDVEAIHDWVGGSRHSLKLTWIHLKSMIYYFRKWGWKLF